MNRLLAYVLLAFTPIAVMAQGSRPPITNADVLSMTKSGLGEQTIILAIQQGPTAFDTSPQALIELKKAGVTDGVLNAMLSASKGQQVAAQGVQPAQAGKAVQVTQERKIKEPAEYNAYMTAVQQTNPTLKGQALEAFLQAYPNSVMKESALELLMVAYQQANDSPRALETATRVLQVNPDNIRALALLAYNYRALASQGGPQVQENLAKSQQYGQRGLQILLTMKKPDGMTDADFTKLHNETGAIFSGAVGFAALQARDFVTAQRALQEAISLEAQPNIADIYPLAVSDLEANPLNPQGFWFVVKAATLAHGSAQDKILDYAHKKYVWYHGSEEGWNELQKDTKASQNVMPQAGFTVTVAAAPPPPSPAQQTTAELQIRVLQEESVPYVQQSGGGISTSCNISGSANTSMTATTTGNVTFGNATTTSALKMNCNSYDTTIRWPHVLNAMLVEASDGNAYIIACDRAWRWSKCVPLRAGETFNARHTSKGMAVQAFNEKGKESEPTYAVLQSKALH